MGVQHLECLLADAPDAEHGEVPGRGVYHLVRGHPKKATWRSLRTSCATWMIEAGGNPKDVQGHMRHSRISTTMDIYAQHVPDSQRRAVSKMMDMVESRRVQIDSSKSATIN